MLALCQERHRCEHTQCLEETGTSLQSGATRPGCGWKHMAGIEKDYLQERRGTARREENKQGTEAVQTPFT